MCPTDSAHGATEATEAGDPPPSTVEEVERMLGLNPGSLVRPFDSVCHYNPTQEDDPAQDCMKPSAWHCKTVDGHMFQPCDGHMGIFLAHYGPIVDEFHEYGSTCGLEGMWWVNGGTETNDGVSFCCSTDAGVALGLLELLDD